jgi:hypothetical protein
MVCGCADRGDRGGEQAPDLVAGQRDEAGLGRRFGGGHGGQEGVGEHGQHGPAVPGGPAADLVFVEGGQLLAGLEGFLDLPAGAGDPDELGEPDRLRGVGAVERQLAGATVAADQQPVPADVVGVGGGVDGVDQRPVVEAGVSDGVCKRVSVRERVSPGRLSDP